MGWLHVQAFLEYAKVGLWGDCASNIPSREAAGWLRPQAFLKHATAVLCSGYMSTHPSFT